MLNVRTVKTISVQDWDHLVTNTYGRPYNFQQQDGCKERQRVSITVPADDFDYENTGVDVDEGMGVSFKTWLERDPTQKLKDQQYDFELKYFWLRQFYPSVESVINDLYSKGLLEAGEYEIDIDW